MCCEPKPLVINRVWGWDRVLAWAKERIATSFCAYIERNVMSHQWATAQLKSELFSPGIPEPAAKDYFFFSLSRLRRPVSKGLQTVHRVLLLHLFSWITVMHSGFPHSIRISMFIFIHVPHLSTLRWIQRSDIFHQFSTPTSLHHGSHLIIFKHQAWIMLMGQPWPLKDYFGTSYCTKST